MNIKILKDIRFWLIFFFIIRLISITNPPLEILHNWRQTTVTMVARNFLEINSNIFFPRIDIAGEKTGITGMEFPLLNYLIYLVSEVFGYQHWYGRLINLIFSSFGLWFFYKLIRKYFSLKTAFNATIILTVSIWFQFSRKIMPDTFSMSLIITCLYYGSNYLESKNKEKQFLHLLWYSILLIFGTLSKIPSAYILIIFAIFLFKKRVSIRKKIFFSTITLLSFIPIILWYYFWIPQLVGKYGFSHFFMGKNFSQGYHEIIQNIPQTLKRFYDSALKYIGFLTFLFGLGIAVYKKEMKIIISFLLTFIVFLIFIFKAGYNFPLHNYYIIPFVPIISLIAGYGLTNINSDKIVLTILILICIEGTTNQIHDFRINKNEKKLLNLEIDLDKVSKKEDLILINSGAYPTPMYFSHRKGWVNYNEKIIDGNYIKELNSKGLKFIVILKKTFGNEVKLQQYKKVLENEDYSIYKSNSIKKSNVIL